MSAKPTINKQAVSRCQAACSHLARGLNERRMELNPDHKATWERIVRHEAMAERIAKDLCELSEAYGWE